VIRSIAAVLGIVIGLALVAGGVTLSRPPTAPPRADEIVSPTVATPAPSASVSPSATPPPTSAAAPSPVALGDGWRIRIARIGIDLPLRDGDPARDIALQHTPEDAAYRLAGTAIPGNGGNTYVYGHARWAQFIGLWYAHLDDLVLLTGPRGTLRYRVTEIHPRVGSDDLEYLLPSESERLTLQTSTGPNATDPRFIVIAVPER